MRSAFIHVGAPKTGTTAIQSALDTHREDLADHGLCNPNTLYLNHAGLIARFHPLGARHFFFKDSCISEEEGKIQSAQLWKQVKKAKGDVIVSSEFLYSANKNYVRMAREFMDVGLTPVFVCYVRHPVDAAISSAQHSVKMGERTISQVVGKPRWHSPVATLKAAKETGQKVVVRDFADVKSTGVVHDFLSSIGYGHVTELVSEPRKNQSLSMEGTILAEIYESYRKKFGDEPFPKSYILGLSGSPFTLPDRVIERIRAESVEEVEFIANEFGLALKEAREPHQFHPRLSNETVVELLRTLRFEV